MLDKHYFPIINQYVDNNFFDIKKLETYLSLHEIVGNEVFEYCFKKSKFDRHFPGWLSNEYGYIPLPIDIFIYRIPFYFYVPDFYRGVNDIIGNLDTLISGMLREKNNKPELEELFKALEYMFYTKGLTLDTIFNYTIKLSGFVSEYWLFMQWNHYLHLCDELKLNDPAPNNFSVRYNEILEASGLPPIIYEIEEYSYIDMFIRDGDIIEFEGNFPCDNDGNPIMKWIGLDIKNPGRTICTPSGHRNRLKVELLPNTIIYALNCYNSSDDEDGTWYQIYAGPLTMDFDYAAIKRKRKILKYTQKQVAEAVGASIRTYQKWESGETTPDGHYLLRILNWLDLPDVQYVTKYID